MNGSWNEDNVSWDNTNINDNQDVQVTILFPNSAGSYRLPLNTAGISLVQGWVNIDSQ